MILEVFNLDFLKVVIKMEKKFALINLVIIY